MEWGREEWDEDRKDHEGEWEEKQGDEEVAMGRMEGRYERYVGGE